MFISNTKKQQDEMLKEIGVSSFEDLIKKIPLKFLNSDFNISEKSLTEVEVHRKFSELACKNQKVLNFVGAGAYERYTPSAVKHIAERGEFLTAYTPYQAEASQGLLQTIYEYQSQICALFDMDVSNASLYDGASALGEAARACARITSRKKILYLKSLNPQYLTTVKTYFGNSSEYEFEVIDHLDGKINIADLENKLDENTACVIAQSPNFFGLLEDMPEISELTHAKGALFTAVTDPMSLGIVNPPGSYDADFAVAEGQSLGLPLNYGGPYLGIFTCKKIHIRQMPGRLVSITKDTEGKRGFVLTLQAREQHIRRDKAASNICSNEALCALMATIYMTLLGPEGIREAAEANAFNTRYALKELLKIDGIKLKFNNPFFNEFVIDFPNHPCPLRKKILQEDAIDIGLPLKKLYPDMENSLLVCATETKTKEDIDKLVSALRKNL
ncbi:MAG: aminomethyl-transferring glycine dehydrogenase subunit GcvPA [Elusimicrobia bacterium]|nr:aminomethyl-transferring glycine dehydrogenase subunit GcvPA [Elusimicrobiota bacterium]